MIRLKTIIEQASREEQVDSLLNKIKSKQFKRIGAGDNGIVYTIQGTNYVFKITRERDEFDVASVIVGRSSEFTCFVPVVYVNDSEKMYIMRNADPLPTQYKTAIDNFYTRYTKFALDMQGEVSIFDYLDAEGSRETETPLVDFLRQLQRQVQRTGIAEFDLDLDFKSDNVMMHQSKMVLVDW
tara:strand:+ start:569 stop:1117 length:549 start_codon:yes stop_codon:yes gene_type:complete